MRNTLILLILFSVRGFSQQDACEDLSIDSTKRITLLEAKLMSDIISKYPTKEYKEMIDYVSVEIIASSSNNTLTASSTSDILTTEQKNILKIAAPGSIVHVKIKYKYKDPANDNIGTGGKIKEMTFKVKASRYPKPLPPCKRC